MKKIGITGGIACGKSLVASQFCELGAVVLDADRMGHQVLRRDAVKQQIKDIWGMAVFDSAMEVDRSALAQIVFENSSSGRAQLAKLEGITHPLIRDSLESQIKDFGRKNIPAVILDAPVMFKSGWDKFCDVIIYVDTTFSTRLTRAKARGWTEEELQRREASQLSLVRKKELSGFVIDNSGTIENTWSQVSSIWDLIVGGD